jgi:uncharacterized delta-60 repeat protein
VSPSGIGFALARYHPDGTPDSTFGGGDGRVTTPPRGDSARDEDLPSTMLVQRDGGLLVGGRSGELDCPGCGWSFHLQRYSSDGRLDLSFGGGDGMVTAMGDQVDDWSEIRALAVQPDGRILAAGPSQTFSPRQALPPSQFRVDRYTSAGDLDPTFDGGDGVVRTPFPQGSQGLDRGAHANTLTLLPGRRIVVAGGLGLRTRAGGPRAGAFAVAVYHQ